MALPGGFWSYVHADDQAEGGRIARLARDIVDAYGIATGEEIELFIDKDGLEWGDQWKKKIDDNLASVAFFIPVITPRFFASAECRHELQFFARKATDLGVAELILPLLYVNVPSLREDSPDDGLAVLIKTLHWKDWTDLRFKSPDSEEYRRAVDDLAQRLIKANADADKTDVADQAQQLEEPDEDEPGWLDKVAESQVVMPQWTETLQAITEEIQSIGSIMSSGSREMEEAPQGKELANRLTVARRLSQQLAAPSDEVYSLSSRFTEQLHAVDAGLRAMIERAPEEMDDDPSNQQAVCEFFDSIRELSEKAHEGLGQVKNLLDTFEPIESASRDLRKPLKRLRRGLTVLLEGREVTDDWVRLINLSGVNCPDTSEGGNRPAPLPGARGS